MPISRCLLAYKELWRVVRTLFSAGCTDHLDWPRLSNREQFKEGGEEADRGNDGKTLKSGLALNGIYYYGKPRTSRSGGSWL